MDSKILFNERTKQIIKADKNVNWDLVKLTTPIGVKIIDNEYIASVYNTTDTAMKFAGILSSKVLVNNCVEVSAIKDGFVYALEIEGMSVGDKIIAGNGVFIKSVGDNSIAEVIEVRDNNYCLVKGLRTQANGGGTGAVNSVNGMYGDVVIEAKNLNANIVGNPALLQSEYNSGIYEAVRDANNKAAAVENELYLKQDKLAAGKGININTNTISLALETSINTSIPVGISNLICSITNMSDLFLVVALSFEVSSVDLYTFYIPLDKAVLKKMGDSIFFVGYGDQETGYRVAGLYRANDLSLTVSSASGAFIQNMPINLNTVIVLNP